MPAMHRIGTAESGAVIVVLLIAVSLALFLLSASRSEKAKGKRGRLRNLDWAAALAVVTAMIVETISSAHNLGLAWWLIIAFAVVGVVILRPRYAASLLPVWLVGYGLAGIGLVVSGTGFAYGLARNDGRLGSAGTAVLLQAYMFLMLGGWLAWRLLSSHPSAARLVLGRMAAPDRPGQLWGLALLPMAVAAGALTSTGGWISLTLVLLAGSIVVIRRSPRHAAQLAAAGFIVLGLVGLLLVKSRFGYHSAGPQADSMRYGMVWLSTGSMVDLGAIEALALFVLGCWLVPRNYPAVGRLLGLVPDAQLSRRLQRLTESRAVAVDTAAADLRRLERDLHDGAQARLVALGMNLRAAEKLIHSSPDAAAALVAEARQASARALTELRELVRGVHPPVLADRGLADAVRALALDCPLTVATDVELDGRLPAPVETACYFSIAELLTNAAKHSGGREARIAVTHAAGMLRVEVTDYGLGGADPSRGTGLAGVEKRLAAFDGILAISSPAGGPTIGVLEVPCALSSLKISSY